MNRRPDYGLEFLLAFNGRIHHLEKGYWLKFDIARVEATLERRHGLSYSFTLHAPDGTRCSGSTTRTTYRPGALGSSIAARLPITGTAPRRIQAGRTSSKTPRH
jgi:hypothetical protein